MVKLSNKALGKRKQGPGGSSSSKPKPKPAPKGKATSSTSASASARTDLGPTGKPKRRPDQPKKVKLRDQKSIPVPRTEFARDAPRRRLKDSDEDDEGDEDEDGDVGMSDDEDASIDDEGLGVDSDIGLEDVKASGFLAGVDQNALSRSVKETKRLHNLQKSKEPLPKPKKKARSPSPDSGSDALDYDFDSDVDFDSELGSEDGGEVGSNDEDDVFDSDPDDDDDDDEDEEDDSEFDENRLNDEFDNLSDLEDDHAPVVERKRRKVEDEAEYEVSGRNRWKPAPVNAEPETVKVGRLPIKMPTGEVRLVAGTTTISVPPPKKPAPAKRVEKEEEEEEEDEDEGSDDGADVERMAGQKGRFGRMGIAEIVSASGWKNSQRLDAAKEQVAAIGAEILAGGELVDIAPVLTRLSTFTLSTVPSPHDDAPPLPVPASIRGLALLSQLAVYKDLIPGYRIRELTEHEEAEKVRDEVRRQREGEKMLVRSYKGYLKALEAEIKNKTPLAGIGIKCMSDLLVSVPHFNFSENIMGVLVGRLGRKTWDPESDTILSALIDVFRSDLTGAYSQSLVRLVARMIKERKFQVNANVLSCLLHLRLRTELSSSMLRDKEKGKGKGKMGWKGRKGEKEKELPKAKSEIRRVWRTKNQRKREKEMKEIRAEMAEAEAEVDQEERANTQTETLKNLFVLYFTIIKHEGRSPLLPAALEGIAHFAHLINIDFFRDLLLVLRRFIADDDSYEGDKGGEETAFDLAQRTRLRLLGIVTAFDLLSGQGEALNIDLSDFINALFALLRPLSIDTTIEDPPQVTSTASVAPARFIGKRGDRAPHHTLTTADMLFNTLEAIFFPRFVSSSTASPPWRTAAFAKRLAESATLVPNATSLRSLVFVRRLMAKERKLAAMIDSDERTYDGVYKPEHDDPQLANAFATSLYEVHWLASNHVDKKVRQEAKKIRDGEFNL